MTFEVGRLSAALTLDGLDQFTRGMDQAGAKLQATTRLADGATMGLAQSIQQVATQSPQSLNLVGSAFTKVGVAAAAASTVAIAKFATFDQAMSAVSAATHESADNMKLLEQAALDAGARTAFSATEAANAIEELSKAGVSTADILSGGLDGALDLAAAGGLGVAEAAGIAAVALKTFNLEGDQMGHVDEVEHAGHAGVHHVLHAARVLVEGGQGRAADGAHLGHGEHVAQVHQVQRGFAHHQHQLAALFEHDVGRAGEQAVAQPVGNRGQGAHGAGRHHHGVAAEGPAGQRGAHVAHIVQLVAGGQGLQRGGAVHTAFVLQGAPACV